MKITLLFLSLSAQALFSAAGADDSAGKPVERKFQAVVDAVDPGRKAVTLRHKPTGFVAETVWDDKTTFAANIKYDIDDLPEDWVECWAASVDAEKKMLTDVGLIRPLPEGAKPPDQAGPVKEKSLFRCKLVRVPVADAKPDFPKRVLTAKHDACYELDVNGERWALVATKPAHRAQLNRDVPFDPARLKPGTPCLNAVYREEKDGNRLVSLQVLQEGNFRSEKTLGGATGATVAGIESEMTRLRGAFEKIADDVKKAAPVRFRVVPELTLQGEPVSLTVEAWAATPPNPQVELEANYLQPDVVKKQSLTLDWKANEQSGTLTRYTTELALKDLPVGQHLVKWRCDIGGDIGEFWRSFAVTDLKTLVVMFHFTAGRPNVEFERYHLPYDYWEESVVSLLGGPLGVRKTPISAKDWTNRSREFRRRGASPNLQILQGNYAGRSGWPAPIPVQFLLEPEEVQRAVFQAAIELAGMAGFDRDAIGFAAYEFGTRTLAIAREAGVRLIGSMCIHQNWQDGSWGINHTGRPLRPYFAATDDFRKPGSGGPNGVVMVSQHDKSILWTEYGVGVFEPAWLERAWVGGGGGGRSVPDEIFMSRDFDLIDAAIQNVQNQRVPYFQSIGIEFSRDNQEDMTTKSNAEMIEYLVRRARAGNVVFCSQAAAADFYRRHDTETPETVFYDPDFWCGLKATESISSTWKPAAYPDLMQIENARYSAFFKKPAALPEYHWDYTKPWNYPDWGNDTLPRNVVGFLVPGEHDKFAVTPKITDTRPMKVDSEMKETPGGLEVTVKLQTSVGKKAFPIALWDLPCEWKSGDGWWSVRGPARFIPIRAPFTGNLNGILEVDAKPGDNEYHVSFATPRRGPASQDIAVEGVQGKVFERDGLSMAYVWPTRPWDAAFELEVPPGREVRYYAAPEGEMVDLPPGRHRLVIEKERWARITGLNREELLRALAPVRNDK